MHVFAYVRIRTTYVRRLVLTDQLSVVIRSRAKLRNNEGGDNYAQVTQFIHCLSCHLQIHLDEFIARPLQPKKRLIFRESFLKLPLVN